MGCCHSNKFISEFKKNPAIRRDIILFIQNNKKKYNCDIGRVIYSIEDKHISITLRNINLDKYLEIVPIIRADLMARYAVYGIQDEDIELCARKNSIYDSNNNLVKSLSF